MLSTLLPVPPAGEVACRSSDSRRPATGRALSLSQAEQAPDRALESLLVRTEVVACVLRVAAFYAYDRHDSQLPCYAHALRTSGPTASQCGTYAVWFQRS
jgi:hypothetical protein